MSEQKPEVKTGGVGGEGKGEGKAKGKGNAKGKGKGGKPKPTQWNGDKDRGQPTQRKGDDDERASISKKISFVLRRGAANLGINVDKEGWIKFVDLLNCDLLADVPDRSEQKIMSVIDESNAQKLRYELKDGTGDEGKLIRAIAKERKEDSAPSPPRSRVNTAASESGMNGEAAAFVPGNVAAYQAQAAMAAQQAAAMAAYQAMAAQQMAAMAGYSSLGGGLPWPYGPGGYPGFAAPAAAAAAMQGGAGPAFGGAGKRFQGCIKSFNTEKGYGFIESRDAYGVYGRDVFLHKAHVGEHVVGGFVSFTVEINKQGMPQGRDIAAGDGSGAKGKGKGKGKGKKAEGKVGEKKEKGGKKDKADAKGDDAEKNDDGEAKEPGPVATETSEAAAPAADAPAAAAAPAADEAEKK